LLIKTKQQLTESDVTDQKVWKERRTFLQMAAALAGAALAPGLLAARSAEGEGYFGRLKKSPFSSREGLTAYEHITGYNNFYEFGTGKRDPAANAREFVTRPWRIRVDGECERPGEIDIEDILSGFTQEERIYRLRCVEAWAMVVPWIGFPLGDLLKRFQPTSRAKYVAFETLHDPERMPGQRRSILDWPYREGLRMDEAMHPLTILSTGLYGELLPNQNGAPLRLVVPWKYGFKSIKSIVRIRFTEKMPVTTWSLTNPREYGFYANVNPAVDHPRWSQKRHRMIGSGFFAAKKPTEPFNGYADEVAALYTGMDLRKWF